KGVPWWPRPMTGWPRREFATPPAWPRSTLPRIRAAGLTRERTVHGSPNWTGTTTTGPGVRFTPGPQTTSSGSSPRSSRGSAVADAATGDGRLDVVLQVGLELLDHGQARARDRRVVDPRVRLPRREELAVAVGDLGADLREAGDEGVLVVGLGEGARR